MNLLQRCSVQRLWIKNSTDGGNAGSTYIDMTGWDGAMLLFTQGTTTPDGSTGKFLIRQSSDASTGGAYVVTHTSACRWDASSGQNVLVVDCYRPLKRYLSVKADMSSGQMFGIAVKYGGRRQGSTEMTVMPLTGRGKSIAMTS